jgi:hypothetical protein
VCSFIVCDEPNAPVMKLWRISTYTPMLSMVAEAGDAPMHA